MPKLRSLPMIFRDVSLLMSRYNFAQNNIFLYIQNRGNKNLSPCDKIIEYGHEIYEWRSQLRKAYARNYPGRADYSEQEFFVASSAIRREASMLRFEWQECHVEYFNIIEDFLNMVDLDEISYSVDRVKLSVETILDNDLPILMRDSVARRRLISYLTEINNATSKWFKFSSNRKSKRFESIKMDINITPRLDVQTTGILLRQIIHCALLVRGSGLHTSSGKIALFLLNYNPNYQYLKNKITNYLRITRPLRYEDLMTYAGDYTLDELKSKDHKDVYYRDNLIGVN